MPVLDVSAWPVDNGFERFVDLFAENKVDSGVLRELTDHHLKDLRIPFGLRLKLLTATSGHANEYPSFWSAARGGLSAHPSESRMLYGRQRSCRRPAAE
jgi:hypothetical protein